MKRFLRKHLIIIFAALAALCLGAAFALFGGVNRVTAKAETPASPCDGTHTDWIALDPTTIQNYMSSGNYHLTAGNYYLTENIIIRNTICIDADNEVTVCLNGYMLYSTAYFANNQRHDIISQVYSGATLNVCDCKSQSSEEGFERSNGYKKLKSRIKVA